MKDQWTLKDRFIADDDSFICSVKVHTIKVIYGPNGKTHTIRELDTKMTFTELKTKIKDDTGVIVESILFKSEEMNFAWRLYEIPNTFVGDNDTFLCPPPTKGGNSS